MRQVGFGFRNYRLEFSNHVKGRDVDIANFNRSGQHVFMTECSVFLFLSFMMGLRICLETPG